MPGKRKPWGRSREQGEREEATGAVGAGENPHGEKIEEEEEEEEEKRKEEEKKRRRKKKNRKD